MSLEIDWFGAPLDQLPEVEFIENGKVVRGRVTGRWAGYGDLVLTVTEGGKCRYPHVKAEKCRPVAVIPGPEPTPEQREALLEALLLAAAEMHEQEMSRETQCEGWREQIILGLADWEQEIPGRGVTFFTTKDGGIYADATDTDEEVGSVVFTEPHCREAVVVLLNAKLKARRLNAAAGLGSQNPDEAAETLASK